MEKNGSFLMSLVRRGMTIDDFERSICLKNKKAYGEIQFQCLALVFCTASFGFSVYNVALGLLDYSTVAAIMLGIIGALGLGLIDRHYLIQGRGAYQSLRLRIIKVRIISLLIVLLSFFLMATVTFRADIDGVIAEETARRKQELMASPEYEEPLKAARNEIGLAAAMIARRDELSRQVTELTAQAKQARGEERNECAGNTTKTATGLITRDHGCGPRARGHAVAAQTLDDQANTKAAELKAIVNPEERLRKAQQELVAIETKIANEAAANTQGAVRRLDVLFDMLGEKPSAILVVAFWVSIGMIPDLLMFVAQARPFQDESFNIAHRLQGQSMAALQERLRLEERRKNADGLEPIDVRLKTQPRLAAVTPPGAANPQPSPAASATPDQEAA